MAFTRPLEDERVRVAAAYWLGASPHERSEANGIILARYARHAMETIRQQAEEIERLKQESARHPYRGTMHYSRRESNFINRMDHNDRDLYVKQFIASCNSKQIIPFIEVIRHDKDWREVEYVIDLPTLPELDRKDTQP